ncbi:MAG: penicillin acylase family protein [Gammaproteobacteria bacterium]
MSASLRSLHLPAIATLALYSGLLVGCASAPIESAADTELRRLASIAERVEIVRDNFGVPHIYGESDADAVFGLLYAQAEDDFNRIEQNYIWATGRLAEVEGEAALFSDLRARLFMTVEEAKAAYADAPGWLKALCDAYADGLNYYLITHPDVTPRLLTRFEPWMPMFFSEGSIGGDIESVDTAGIRNFYGADTDAPAVAQTQARFPEPKGSNGFAIARDLTANGNTLFLINPHTSFYFRPEVHVVSQEGLNAYGAVTWGQFFVYQGFNENTGWMHTSTYVDFKDQFVEDVFEKDGELVYRYGDELRPVDVSSVTLKYRDGGKMAERRFPMYHTHHGPITHRIDGKWVATKLNWDPVHALRQSFVRTKLRNHDEFREMMRIRRNSSNNTVYADSSGNIAYYHGNFIPRRDPQFDYSKPVDGTDPATDWQGLHTVEETISILNPPNGWIQNCNSTPFTAAGPFSPKREDYPVYMAPDAENFRGVHAVNVLSGQTELTLEALLDLAYDPAMTAFDVLLPGLFDAYAMHEDKFPQLSDAISLLRAWDRKAGVDSVAMTLAHFYGLRLAAEATTPPDLNSRSVEFMQFLATQTPTSQRVSVLADTLAELTDDYGQWRTTWGEVNRFQRLTGDIVQPHDDAAPSLAVGFGSGRWGALASFGARRYPGTKRLYGSSGNSFVAVVEFGERVRAKSMLAGGQSGDPASPHFDDQAQRYVERQFKEVAYYRDDVDARAVRRYRPGYGDGAP